MSSTLTEYGAKVCVNVVPSPVTFGVTGTIFVGSVIELVSRGLAASGDERAFAFKGE
jgi:hypothetical protein